MKKIHDITGVLRGMKIVQEVASKDLFKLYSNLIPKDYISVNGYSQMKLNNNFNNTPKTISDAIYLIFYQTVTLANYKFNNQNLQQKSKTEVFQKSTSSSSKPSGMPSEYDPIDRQLIEEFRSIHFKSEKKLTEIKDSPQLDPANQQLPVELGQSHSNSEHSSQKKLYSEPTQNFGHARSVPSSELSRAMSFASLFARVSMGALAESTRRQIGMQSSAVNQNPFLTRANVERIVASLCRVRGAALKLGQMISIQDAEFLSPEFAEILSRVRQHADFMPIRQARRVLAHELGHDWETRGLFSEFEEQPFAAASIGQVHRATVGSVSLGNDISSSSTPVRVAVKIQYPGVRASIDSDIANLVSMLRLVSVLPPGLHADKAIEVAKRELAWECDYRREAEFSNFFSKEFAADPVFVVPRVIPELSTEQVLTTELVEGVSLDNCVSMDQELRDWIGSQMMRLCLTELFKLRTMQTDPNWSNFLFNERLQKIYLIDFGASRHYEKHFVDDYLRLIKSASIQDQQSILRYSRQLGFLTGFETRLMEQAHINAVSILGEVFTASRPFDFGSQSTTRRIKELIPIMLQHRLTSPPEESYSLHRKLSGGFLLCSKLRARVSCSHLFGSIYEAYQFD